MVYMGAPSAPNGVDHFLRRQVRRPVPADFLGQSLVALPVVYNGPFARTRHFLLSPFGIQRQNDSHGPPLVGDNVFPVLFAQLPYDLAGLLSELTNADKEYPTLL